MYITFKQMTFEGFKNYIESIKPEPAEFKEVLVKMISDVANDDMGYIWHYVFNQKFGTVQDNQLLLGVDGEGVSIDGIEDLWRLLKQNYKNNSEKNIDK